MISHNFFSTIFIIPTLNLLVLFYMIFYVAHLPGAFGFAIIALVVFVRAILHPFFVQQIETQRKMQEIKPHLDRAQAKHKKDPKKLQEEQMRIYREAGLNPAAGCLTMIIQLPVFIGLYSTLSLFLHNGTSPKLVAEINKILYVPAMKLNHVIDVHFFGFNLALAPNKAHIWYYYLVPVITGLLQYAQAQYATPMYGANAAPDPVNKDDKKIVKKGEEEKKSDSGDFQKALNMQMKYFFPFMIGYFAYTLPVGLALYWNIFSIFSILQYRRVMSKSTIIKS